MKTIKYSLIYALLSLFLIVFISCSEKKSKLGAIDLASIATVTPKQLTQFDQVDSLYFSHISYKSIAIASNRVVIADRQNKFVVLMDDKGNLIKKIREGRGPSEVLDVYEMTRTSNNTIYLNDSDNKKILIFDESLGFIKEFKPKPYSGTSITGVYPVENEGLIFEMTSFAFLQDKEKEREKIFVQYDVENQLYGKEIVLKDRPFARTYIDGRLAGASQVPFSNITLTSYNPERKSMYVYETSKSKIIEMDADFDTLNIVTVSLPKEILTDTEIDSLQEGRRAEQWKTMMSYLPEYKSEAERFFYNENEFWLQSNLRGDYQKWFVLNMAGQIIKVVHLPKDVMVTHVSEHHIGVRLDKSTFSLYKAVE